MLAKGPPKLVADMLVKIGEPTTAERVGVELFHLARGDPCIADGEEPKLLTEMQGDRGASC